jgi:hypothetical protein
MIKFRFFVFRSGNPESITTTITSDWSSDFCTTSNDVYTDTQTCQISQMNINNEITSNYFKDADKEVKCYCYLVSFNNFGINSRQLHAC